MKKLLTPESKEILSVDDPVRCLSLFLAPKQITAYFHCERAGLVHAPRWRCFLTMEGKGVKEFAQMESFDHESKSEALNDVARLAQTKSKMKSFCRPQESMLMLDRLLHEMDQPIAAYILTTSSSGLCSGQLDLRLVPRSISSHEPKENKHHSPSAFLKLPRFSFRTSRALKNQAKNDLAKQAFDSLNGLRATLPHLFKNSQ